MGGGRWARTGLAHGPLIRLPDGCCLPTTIGHLAPSQGGRTHIAGSSPSRLSVPRWPPISSRIVKPAQANVLYRIGSSIEYILRLCEPACGAFGGSLFPAGLPSDLGAHDGAWCALDRRDRAQPEGRGGVWASVPRSPATITRRRICMNEQATPVLFEVWWRGVAWRCCGGA